MRLLIITLSLIALSGIIRAQDLPLKNGQIYYRFENKLGNTKVCLSNYFDFPTKYPKTASKLINKNNEYITKNNSNLKPFLGSNIVPSSFSVITPNAVYEGKSKLKCADTLKTMGSFSFTLPTSSPKLKEYFLLYQIASINKDKIISQKVTGTIEFVFLNKSEYILKIKGITLNTMYSNLKVEEQLLGPLYEAFQKDDKKSKELAKFFTMIDDLIKSIDNSYKETLTELYNEDELD